MVPDPVLQAANLGKRFGSRWAVRDLNLAVPRGEVFGFLGPNGAGKSTTIRMILSLITPTSGSIELFGKSLRHHRSEVLARVGGLVEQADFYLYLSARRNLEIVAALRGGATRKEIDAALDTVGLLSRAEDRVKTFSHGMKQRLGIAQALLGAPELIILDEPTQGLDPGGIKEIRELVRRLSADQKITVFLSSHLLSEIEQTATSMAIINGGTLVVQGKVKELLEEQDALVRLHVHPVEAALRVLGEQRVVSAVTAGPSGIEVRMPAANVPALAKLLVDAGVEIHSLTPRRSLEEYFLSLTEQGEGARRQRP
jgi:ABC-type multidrug transport system ATPase subunit